VLQIGAQTEGRPSYQRNSA